MPSVYFYEIKQPPELHKVPVASLHSQKTLKTALLRVLIARTNSLVATCYTFLVAMCRFSHKPSKTMICNPRLHATKPSQAEEDQATASQQIT